MIADLKQQKFYFVIALLLILGYVSWLLVKPFLSAVLLSFVIAFIFYPLHKKLNKKLQNKKLSAMLIAIFIILLVLVPTFFIAKLLTQELFVTYLLTRQKFTAGYLSTTCTDESNVFCNIATGFKEIIANPETRYYIDQALEKVKDFAAKSASDLIVSIPLFLLNAFVTFFVVYFILRDAKPFRRWITKFLPFSKPQKRLLVTRFKEVSYAVIYGTLLTALIQGVFAIVGYAIFDVPSPFLWGVVTGFAALLPLVGTPIVWVPIALVKIVTGYVQGDGTMIGMGIGLLVYGTLVIALVDNLVKPKIIGDRAGVHPVIVLLGVLGGVSLLGFVGLLVGPLILALFITLIRIYETGK
ncbi:AI-2E family transporter [Candidatus Woesearchaeota archaeon]|nr:AI-2E family transporter [Candidatus Woesearchaeota archaeon]